MRSENLGSQVEFYLVDGKINESIDINLGSLKLGSSLLPLVAI